MQILQRLIRVLRSAVEWLHGHFRIVKGRDKTPWSVRLVSACALASIVMVLVFSVKLVRTHSRLDIRLATSGEGGEYHAFGDNLQRVIDDSRQRIRLTVEHTAGSRENIRLLEARKVDMAIVQHDIPTKPSVQAIASLFPEVFHLLVQVEIDGIQDLKGKRLAVSPSLLGVHGDPNDPNSFIGQLVTRHGMTHRDVRISAMRSLDEASRAFLHENVDAIALFIAVGNDCMSGLLRQSDRPAKLLSVDATAMKTWYPYVEDAVVPKGAYWSVPVVPKKTVPTVSVQAMLLTHSRVNKGAVTEITRVLYEHRNTLMARNPRAATVRLPGSGEDLGIPLHPGAKAYYRRDRPGFLVTYADPIALCLSLSVLCFSTAWQLRLGFQQRQKNRADTYNLELMALIEQSHNIQSMSELLELRRKLFGIFKSVIHDLDEDKLSVESFQLFNVPCQVAIGAIRHREWAIAHGHTEEGPGEPDTMI